MEKAIFKRHGTVFADFARRAMYIKPLFWQALKTRVNF